MTRQSVLLAVLATVVTITVAAASGATLSKDTESVFSKRHQAQRFAWQICTAAIDQELYRDCYTWALQGLSYGYTSRQLMWILKPDGLLPDEGWLPNPDA